MPARPLIGVAPDLRRNRKGKEMVATYRNYLRCIEAAGGNPVLLSPSLRLIRSYVSRLDALLLTGGDDIHPRHFGQRRRAVPMTLNPELRTRFEVALTRSYLRTRRPILGVCLGAQILNIVRGGTLLQDIRSQRPKANDHRKGMHVVSVSPDTLLYRLVKKSRLRVNSSHHQAIDRIGRGFLISAHADDDIVEAIELAKHPFALGVQWHPEEPPNSLESQKLFSALIRATA